MPRDYPTPKVSKRLRFEVFRRDGFRCRYCGATPGEAELTVDHAIPAVLGGSNKPENLATACRACNSGKATVVPDAPVVEALDADAFRWGKAMERAAEQRRDELRQTIEKVSLFDDIWSAWSWTNPQGEPRPFRRDPLWQASVERFIYNGLDHSELEYFVAIAMNSKAAPADVWTYFCGCCWTEIRKRQDLARSFIDADTSKAIERSFVVDSAGVAQP